MKNLLLISTLLTLVSSSVVLPITDIKANAPQEAPSSISTAGAASPQITLSNPTLLPPGVGQSTSPPGPATSVSPDNTSSHSSSPSVHRGFNVPAWVGGQNTPVKQKSDWITAFNRIKSIGNGFHAARIYATEEGGTKILPDILAAANETDTMVLVGIYLGANDNNARFNQEFTVLKEAIDTYGCKNIIGITVGNEDIYRHDSTPELIASEITQVQQYLDQAHPDDCVPVGHVDTWTWIVDPTSAPVTKGADFLLANIFPYWENSLIAMAPDYFNQALKNISSFEKANDIEVWIGETGWPMTQPPPSKDGTPLPKGVVGKNGMQTYWQQIVCGQGFMQRNAFYYADLDGIDAPSWGVFDTNGGANIDFKCGPV